MRFVCFFGKLEEFFQVTGKSCLIVWLSKMLYFFLTDVELSDEADELFAIFIGRSLVPREGPHHPHTIKAPISIYYIYICRSIVKFLSS